MLYCNLLKFVCLGVYCLFFVDGLKGINWILFDGMFLIEEEIEKVFFVVGYYGYVGV